MKSIEIMVNEHENIRRMLKVVRGLSYQVMTLGEFHIEDVDKIIDFIRTYADRHHHGKEEDILFKTMNEKIDRLRKAGSITGMYIEHDLGRLYMTDLEAAVKDYNEGSDEARLDIIANAIGYANLLERHIEKENMAMYRFAETMLEDEDKKYIEKEAEKIEIEAKEKGLQEKYIKLLERLEEKYLK
ncbi:MAG: hemerythrin domain-containing protein [Tissierella sp.]|uniref:hemerythrin domain-containing protein n=1 Tax=Tissierella sp. TaxID=41274 RepID=UPI003F9A71A0